MLYDFLPDHHGPGDRGKAVTRRSAAMLKWEKRVPTGIDSWT
ncbi:MAG: hypothetical protein ACKO23_19135 [Gemmataceae bacterium]